MTLAGGIASQFLASVERKTYGVAKKIKGHLRSRMDKFVKTISQNKNHGNLQHSMGMCYIK